MRDLSDPFVIAPDTFHLCVNTTTMVEVVAIEKWPIFPFFGFLD